MSAGGLSMADVAALVLRFPEDPKGVGQVLLGLDAAELRSGLRDAIVLLSSAVAKNENDRARVAAALATIPPNTPDEASAPFIARTMLELWAGELNLAGSLRQLIALGTVG